MLFLLSLLLSCGLSLNAQDKAPHYLFIGNSFTIGSGDKNTTSLNGVPGMVALLAEAGGHVKPDVMKCTQAGYSLQDHLNNTRKWEAFVDKRPWSAVVLQEYSTLPTSYDNGEKGDIETFVKSAKQMESIFESQDPDIKIYLFQTWAREKTHHIYHRNFQGGPEQMFKEVREGYQRVAKEIGATLIPAGDAWELSIKTRPELNLYLHDRYHASTLGSYLNALVIYAVVYDADPRGLPPLATVTADEATYLQNIAWQTVSKSAESK